MSVEKPPLHGEGDATPEVGLLQQRLIGRVVVQWSKVDAGLNEIIWRFLHISIEDGRIVTGRLDPQQKIAMARKLAERHLQGELFEKLSEALILADALRDDRNFIVHGTWGTLIREGVAVSLSLRGKAGPGEIKAETFSHERMWKIIRDIFLVKDALIAVVNSLPPLPDK